MSSLPEKEKPENTSVEELTCWQHSNCFKTLCRAYGKKGVRCWLIPRTHCTNYIVNDFLQKLPTCLACAYFKKVGESHPKGWDFFLTDQLRQYHQKTFEEIYRKEESFVEILNRIPDGLFTTDREWRITYFNPAAEKITGFSATDAVGMYCRDVFKNSICDSDCALQKAIRENTDIHNREYEITDIEGRQVPILCSTSAFRNSKGEITGGIEIFKDITEQKRLQAEISRREKKYRRIFEGSHDMIYTSTLEGGILDINEAGVEMMGYDSKEEILQLGSAAKLYQHPHDREKFLELINRDGFVKDFEVNFVRKNGRPIHVLVSSRRYQNPFTGAIEYEGIIKDITRRKKAEEDIKQRNRELSIINSIAVVLNFSMDLNFILKETLQRVLLAIGVEQGGIFLIEPETKTIELRAKIGLHKGRRAYPTARFCFKDPLLMEHLIHKNTVLPPEASFPPFQVGFQADPDRPEQLLTCFLVSSKGRSVGFFGFQMPASREFSRYELHMLGSLGNFLGGTIENAMLVDTIRQHRQELHKLTEKLFESQEEERRRIARELHDEAGQSLTAVKLGLDRLEQKIDPGQAQLVEELKETRKMLVRTSSEIRRLSYNLHPTLLSDLGLEPALNVYFKEIRSRAGLDVEFKMIGFDQRLDKNLETALYRFSQEAMNNTLKHSGAEVFKIKIIKSYPKIIFTAEDDGVGFDPTAIDRDRPRLGLLGMRERAALLGGTFQIQGRPGKGTKIRIEISMQKETTGQEENGQRDQDTIG